MMVKMLEIKIDKYTSEALTFNPLFWLFIFPIVYLLVTLKLIKIKSKKD